MNTSFLSILSTTIILAIFVQSVCSEKDQPWPPPQCTWKPDPGPCRAFFRRYYYNNQTRACDVFVHGGCGGCVPFRTNQQCEAAHCDLINVAKSIPLFSKPSYTNSDMQLFIMEADTVIE